MAVGENAVNHTSELLKLADDLYQDTISPIPSGKTPGDIRTLATQRGAIANLLSYHSAQLNRLNPVAFQFMNEAQKKQLEKQLIFTLYLFAAQAQLDDAERRVKNLAGSIDGINQCLLRLAELKKLIITEPPEENKDAQQVKDAQKQAQLNEEIDRSEKYLKLLGLTVLAPLLTSTMMHLMGNQKKMRPADKADDVSADIEAVEVTLDKSKLSGFADGKKTTLSIEYMSAVNNRRLYWVWGGGMLAAVLELLASQGVFPTDQVKNAQEKLSTPSPVTGYMSWLLYYTRFGINLFLLLEHTIPGSWMRTKEMKIPAWERFTTQWDQRKFALLNDSIWATANMACFFWLRGGGTLGYAGNVLTAVLLLMDLSLTIWMFAEESTKHNREIEALYNKKLTLESSIAERKGYIVGRNTMFKDLKELLVKDEKSEAAIQKVLDEKAKAEAEMHALEEELKQFNKTIKQSEIAWKYRKYGLINSIAYAAGLLFAFCLVCCFFFPPALLAPGLVLAMGAAGAALCFTVTLISAIVSGSIELAKTKEAMNDARAECTELLKLFLSTQDPNMKKFLYLEMKGLMAESDYQQALIKFQTIKLIRSILVDAFVPALVFAAILFMPLGIGVAVMAAGFAVALISHLIINRFEPKPPEGEKLADFKLDAFDSEFRKFSDKVSSIPTGAETATPKVTESDVLELFGKPKSTGLGWFAKNAPSKSVTDEELNPLLKNN